VTEDVTLARAWTEAIDVVEFGHFHVGMAISGGVASCRALQQPVLVAKARACIGLAKRMAARVEDSMTSTG